MIYSNFYNYLLIKYLKQVYWGGVKVMNSVPFIPEIKMVMDWTFLPTSLDLF